VIELALASWLPLETHGNTKWFTDYCRFFAASRMQLNACSLKSDGTYLTVKPLMISSQQAAVLGFDNPGHLAEPTVRTC